MECKETGVAHGGADEDVRVLRRLKVKEGFTGVGVDEDASVCAVVDVETTGLDPNSDAVSVATPERSVILEEWKI